MLFFQHVKTWEKEITLRVQESAVHRSSVSRDKVTDIKDRLSKESGGKFELESKYQTVFQNLTVSFLLLSGFLLER